MLSIGLFKKLKTKSSDKGIRHFSFILLLAEQNLISSKLVILGRREKHYLLVMEDNVTKTFWTISLGLFSCVLTQQKSSAGHDDHKGDEADAHFWSENDCSCEGRALSSPVTRAHCDGVSLPLFLSHSLYSFLTLSFFFVPSPVSSPTYLFPLLLFLFHSLSLSLSLSHSCCFCHSLFFPALCLSPISSLASFSFSL